MTGYRADPGSGAATDWSAYDVPAMWSMIGNFDPGPQWRHVAGWQRASALAERHLFEMRLYRDRLAEAWPLSPGSASSAYVAEVDKLIASVQATYESAATNHGVMSAATQAIAGVRDKLKPVYEQWQANVSTMAAYEAAVDSARSGVPAPMPGPPPLSPVWRDELNAQARRVMEAVSGELALASLSLETPPEYRAPAVSRDTGTAVGQPFIPPAIPSTKPRRRSTTPNRFPEGAGRVAPPLRGRAGAQAQPVPTAPGVRADVGAGRVVARSWSAQATTQVARQRQPSPTVRARSTSPVRPLPPGGVIGLGPHGIAGLLPEGRTSRHVNPVGGVLTGMPAAAAERPGPRRAGSKPVPAGSPTDGQPVVRTPGGHVVSITGPTARREHRASSPGWDSDDPWAAAGGVSPVIEPVTRRTRHDPGPAIGLAE